MGDTMKKTTLEWLTYGITIVVLCGAGWFWSAQVRSVLEVLEMAYG